MTVLLGIVVFHFLVMVGAKLSIRGSVPYISIFFLTALMVFFVVAMMYTMEPPA